MNINIPPGSLDWLFSTPEDADEGRLWSLGRFPPPINPGDEIVFRYHGRAIAVARCHSVHKPGEHNCVRHDGLRELKGHKVVWLNRTFVDIRKRPDIAIQIDKRQKKARRAAAAARDAMLDRHGLGAEGAC